jgi:hypothetical protein
VTDRGQTRYHGELGLVLGVAQTVALPRRTTGWIWAAALPVLWALGRTATTPGWPPLIGHHAPRLQQPVVHLSDTVTGDSHVVGPCTVHRDHGIGKQTR